MQNRLTEVPLFRGLDDAALAFLNEKLHRKRFGPGEGLFDQGDEGDCLYLIEKGVVRISRVTAAGKEITLALRSAGEFVGEMSLIDGLPRSASACAQGDECICWVLQRSDLQSLLRSQPEAAFTLLRVLSRRLREASEHLEEMAFSTIQQRLATLILRLCQAEGQVQPNGAVLLPGWVSYQSLSTMLGTARECVNRVAVEFVGVGALERQGRRLVVTNLEVLEAVHQGVDP